MRILRSGRALPQPQLETLISSPETFPPSMSDPSVTVAADEGGSMGKQVFKVSVAGCSHDAREERRLKLRSRSRVSQQNFSTGSDAVEKQDDKSGSLKEGGLVNGLVGKVDVVRGIDDDDAFKAIESPSGVVVRSVDRHLAEEGEKKGEACLAAPMEVGYMSLRSGSRVPKRKIGDVCVDSVLVSENVDRFSGREAKRMEVLTPHCECVEKSGGKMLTNVGGIVSEAANWLRCSEENKMKDVLVAEEDRLGMDMNGIFSGATGIDDIRVRNSESGEIGFYSREDESIEDLILEDLMLISGSEDDLNADPAPESLHEKKPICDDKKYQVRPRRYSMKEKGKAKLVSKELTVADGEQVAEQVTAQEVEFTDVSGPRKQKTESSQRNSRSRREAARNTAIELAPQFAFFKAEEEITDDEVEADDLILDANEEDWPGPFSTAMKIIAERESILSARSLNYSSLNNGEAEVKIPWTPSNAQRHKTVGKLAPQLKDLCLKVLCENAEEVESLEGLPDVIKHNIAMLLCHSRRMSFRLLGLLTKGSPFEIYLSDCSWATDKQFEEVFSQCNIDNLKVLQLDFCGRCLPDYVLHSTFAKAPNCLPSLNRLSLKGAYCLSDDGLNAIVASAPLLRSLNLSQCSLITSKGILAVAEKLESGLQELYIDVCHNVDAMLILPALKKLTCLEVLSIAHMETVTDKFLKHLIPICGSKMRVLIISGCRKLTNASMKVIGESCRSLSYLDIRHLDRLNDSAIQHLVNGGCQFQTLKLCLGAFSDAALAAFLEASGATLVELVLNNIEKAAGNTALAISRRCSLSLRSLDLSFCRRMTDEALGLIVDSCLNLEVLKLFGCPQVTDVFLEGHSNSLVKIIGLKGSILKEIEMPNFS
ncbi:uncharacterized protein LOC110023180 isoform X2 [Phalaenopsis equestris]|uniref:uncharacterized protein LOC110023180 isoform X2 n=1 Tax=Phalaenopsis equestris TaxID=78828 RepID=UPI0009E5632B|nr:uncharacterized protein LOC110023180 isoform X2 [Phalaenopsis equestris]